MPPLFDAPYKLSSAVDESGLDNIIALEKSDT